MPLKELKPGDRLTPGFLVDLWRAALRAAFDVAPPLEMVDVGGKVTLRLSRPQRFLARIEHGTVAHRYAWKQVVPAGGGTWADNILVGTTLPDGDGATEFNLNDAVPGNAVVEMVRQIDGSLRFQYGACGS